MCVCVCARARVRVCMVYNCVLMGGFFNFMKVKFQPTQKGSYSDRLLLTGESAIKFEIEIKASQPSALLVVPKDFDAGYVVGWLVGWWVGWLVGWLVCNNWLIK